jgi:hypothetical protein
VVVSTLKILFFNHCEGGGKEEAGVQAATQQTRPTAVQFEPKTMFNRSPVLLRSWQY